MLAILNSLKAHIFPILQPIMMILVSKFMVYRALSDKIYLSLGLLSPLRLIFAAYWEIFHAFLLSADFFQISFFFLKKSFRNTIRVSNSWDPDQARHFVGPRLGQDCLQRLSADDTRR